MLFENQFNIEKKASLPHETEEFDSQLQLAKKKKDSEVILHPQNLCR